MPQLHDIPWYFTVAFTYLVSFGATAYILVAAWRKDQGDHTPVPWTVVWIISFLGPIGLVVAIVAYTSTPRRR